MSVGLVLLDHRELLRRGLADALLEPPESTVRILAGAATLEEVPDSVGAPDVVLIGPQPAPGSADEVCTAARRRWPRVRVIVVVAGEDDADLAGAVRAGATGYLREDASAGEVRQAVDVVASGGSLLSPALVARVLDEFATLARRTAPPGSEAAASLTTREREVLTLLAEGLGNRAIGERLFISQNTVKNHVRAIHEKLQAHSRTEAVIRAMRDGLVDLA